MSERVQLLASRFVEFHETGEVPDGLFTDDVFCDFTMPLWRVQAQGVDATVRLRKHGHPGPGKVPRWRFDPTPSGFVIEFEEHWEQDGKEWYSRELARIEMRDDRIASMSVYCTGDWDAVRRARHAAEVTLIRP
jgi:hypothetical protein